MAKTKLLLKRLQVDLNPEQQAKLEYLRSMIGLSSQTEAVRAAITFAVLHLKGRDAGERATPPLALQNDPLGLAANPRTSVRMLELCRERFLRTKDLDDFWEWAGVLDEILELYGTIPQWIVGEVQRFNEAWISFHRGSISADLLARYPRLAQAMRTLGSREEPDAVKPVGRRRLATTA